MAERLLIAAASMAVTFYAVLVLRRRVAHERLIANNEFAGFAYAIIGAIYGVYLAFTVVVVWEQFGEAESNATAEAVHLSQVWRDVEVVSGGVLTVGLAYLTATEHVWVQAAVTSAVAGLIVFSLLIVAALRHPFAGDVSVQPEALTGVRDSLVQRLEQRASPPALLPRED